MVELWPSAYQYAKEGDIFCTLKAQSEVLGWTDVTMGDTTQTEILW